MLKITLSHGDNLPLDIYTLDGKKPAKRVLSSFF